MAVALQNRISTFEGWYNPITWRKVCLRYGFLDRLTWLSPDQQYFVWPLAECFELDDPGFDIPSDHCSATFGAWIAIHSCTVLHL
ncbi:MAG: hypothetical protein H0V72_04215 [Bradyrhizobium sp.]|nr:hypothetical protein [Bradyrhizobium sp.]